MSAPVIEPLSAADAPLLALNNRHAEETSFLTPGAWAWLIDHAFLACRVEGAAFLIVLDRDAPYDNDNFRWISARYDRFVYIDRIVVSAGHRGRGLARHLYEHLFDKMRAAGHQRVVCEVNLDPPNPGSDAFHDRLGFEEIGQQHLPGRAKTVRYLAKQLGDADPSNLAR